jgi:hypothetical protein
LKKLDYLIGLKTLKLFHLWHLSNENKTILLVGKENFFSLVNTPVLTSCSSVNKIGNLVYKDLNIFKKVTYNQFILYSILNKQIKFSNVLSNYNINYLFFFYKSYSMLFNQKNLTNIYNTNLFFFKYFISKFLNNFSTDKKFLIKIQKNSIILNQQENLYKLILLKSRRLIFLKEINISVQTFLAFVFSVFLSKDIVLFKNFLKYTLEATSFPKHKKYLYTLRVILNLVFDLTGKQFNMLGIYIKIKGKIGVGGSLKKKIFVFKKGVFSFTKKNQKINYTRDAIRTYSGVLGFEAYIAYK